VDDDVVVVFVLNLRGDLFGDDFGEDGGHRMPLVTRHWSLVKDKAATINNRPDK
jgi:hypothetical protein